MATKSRPTRRSLLLVPPLAGLLSAMNTGAASAQTTPLRLVAFGDSLSAGYLLPADAAFPVVLEKALRSKGLNVEVANAGVSGDTTAGGLARLDWSVPDGVQGVILELGANDALRGLDPALAEQALDTIITRLRARRIKVLLAGMLAPRNNGPEYSAAFDAMYPRLATKHGLRLYPFFLEGVLGEQGMTLADRMHPSRQGVETIVARILPTVELFIADIVAGT